MSHQMPWTQHQSILSSLFDSVLILSQTHRLSSPLSEHHARHYLSRLSSFKTKTNTTSTTTTIGNRMENQIVDSLKEDLKKLNLLSYGCCIYKVTKRLRELNEEAYTPQVVSIGPLHHGRSELKAMEEHKIWYLHDFLQRSNASIEGFVTVIKEKEARVRDCYAEPSEFNSNVFIKMTLVDAVFIIELFLRSRYPNLRTVDRIYFPPWMLNEVRWDLHMLENQLPFFILEDLFRVANIEVVLDNNQVQRPSLLDLTYEFFKRNYPIDQRCAIFKSPVSEVEHLLHYLTFCYLPSSTRPEQSKTKTINIPSIAELHRAGVKFKLGSNNCLFDIKFNNGVLELPKIEVSDNTELIFRNLLAFERCHSNDFFIADYVGILKCLLNAPKDVELLVRERIIENWVEDCQAVSTLFHDLDKQVFGSRNHFHFTPLVKDLNAYYNSSWHKWKANLKQNYLSTPWAVISVIAAIVLLILTFIQTICSILQVS